MNTTEKIDNAIMGIVLAAIAMLKVVKDVRPLTQGDLNTVWQGYLNMVHATLDLNTVQLTLAEKTFHHHVAEERLLPSKEEDTFPCLVDTSTPENATQGILSKWGVAVSQCACCGRTLTDGVSIERGVGPICSRKYYELPDSMEPDFGAALVHMDRVIELGCITEEMVHGTDGLMHLLCKKEDSRAVANLLSLACAANYGMSKVFPITEMIHALGYQVLAKKIDENNGAIRIEKHGAEFWIKTPYSPEMNHDLYLRKICSTFEYKEGWGRAKVRICKASKVNKALIWNVLCKHFPGFRIVSEKGRTNIPV